jgi:hypothetical protein
MHGESPPRSGESTWRFERHVQTDNATSNRHGDTAGTRPPPLPEARASVEARARVEARAPVVELGPGALAWSRPREALGARGDRDQPVDGDVAHPQLPMSGPRGKP